MTSRFLVLHKHPQEEISPAYVVWIFILQIKDIFSFSCIEKEEWLEFQIMIYKFSDFWDT